MKDTFVDQRERENFYNARSAFVDRYCAAKTWDANNLSWERIQEIRSQPEWDSPPVVADPETFDCLPDDTCNVCGGSQDVGSWGIGQKPMWNVCAGCFAGSGFHDFLVREFERAMVVHDENRKLPDGRWTTEKYDAVL